ncbi:MAG: hypothetical protein QXM02_00515 [Thermoproteota archaeon]
MFGLFVGTISLPTVPLATQLPYRELFQPGTFVLPMKVLPFKSSYAEVNLTSSEAPASG